MNNRIAIGCFYNKTGVVGDYFFFLIDEIRKTANHLIVVVNGEIISKYYEKLLIHADEVIVRENKGFDSGAFKDIIIEKYDTQVWRESDELVLFNSSIYGPLYKLDGLFELMMNQKVDWWGVEHVKNERRNYIVPSFLVINKTMLHSERFITFWSNLKYADSFLQACQFFEDDFMCFFEKAGYVGGDIISSLSVVEGESHSGTVYATDSYYLVKKLKCPFIRRKAISIYAYNDACETLEHIKRACGYNVNLIESDMEQMENSDSIYPFSKKRLEAFVINHPSIYFIGHGRFAKGLAQYFAFRNWTIDGYIVSTPNSEDEKSIESVKKEKGVGLIVAMNDQPWSEVKDKIYENFGHKDVLSYG